MPIRKYVLRFSVVFLGMFCALLFFGTRLFFIQVFHSTRFSHLASRQHHRLIEIEPLRGSIFDRKQRPLAFNVTAYSLYANPRALTKIQKQDLQSRLPSLIHIDKKYLADQLAKDKFFVWLKRKLSPDEMQKVKDARIHGIGFKKESRRYYPNGSLGAHVIGFAGMDNRGLEGVELLLDKELKGSSGWTTIVRDARQRDLVIENKDIAPQDGSSVVLTIDETIQFIAEQALNHYFEKHSAAAVSIIVLDVHSGEILALANRPTYDLSDFRNSPIEARTNRAISYVYEPGSVFKIVAASAALEETVFKEKDKIFCENGAYRVGNNILEDHHPLGWLTFSEVIEQSSNIGTVKVAQKLGPQTFYDYVQRFRFGKPTGIDLAGEVNGYVKHPRFWSKTTIGAMPIGYEVTVTPLQVVSAMASIANDGIYMRPYIIKMIKNNQGDVIREIYPQEIGRTISVDTARRMTEILKGVVERGTGKRAQIKGVQVAGKTGTARKVVAGRYAQGKYYASFVGFAPAEDPQIAAVVVVDEPKPYYYGGSAAAPVFQELVANTLRYLDTQGK